MSVPGTVPQFSDIPAARDQLGLGPLATVTSIQGGSVSNGVFTVSAVGSLPNGTSGAPALAFTSETTLGLYRLSAGVIGITGGLTAASATDLVLSGGATSGNVVINTNGSTLAATFSGANTALAGNLTVTKSLIAGDASGTSSHILKGGDGGTGSTILAVKDISNGQMFGIGGTGVSIFSNATEAASDGSTYSLRTNGGFYAAKSIALGGNLTVSGTGTTSIAGDLAIAGVLKLGNAYAAGVVAATGTVDIKDSTGTTYHVLVHT